MAAALGQRGTEMEATAKFVKIVDRFFDCLNVGNYTDGKFSRNPFKQPYCGANDFWLKVCYCMHIFVNRPIPPLLYIDLQPAIYLAVVGNRFLGIPGGMAKDSGGEKRLHSK